MILGLVYCGIIYKPRLPYYFVSDACVKLYGSSLMVFLPKLEHLGEFGSLQIRFEVDQLVKRYIQ